jgi:hypothetical protein
MKSSLAKETEKQYLDPKQQVNVVVAVIQNSKRQPSFRKHKKTSSWRENKDAVLASVRDPRWSFDPTDEPPLPSNWWDTMKQSLEGPTAAAPAPVCDYCE